MFRYTIISSEAFHRETEIDSNPQAALLFLRTRRFKINSSPSAQQLSLEALVARLRYR